MVNTTQSARKSTKQDKQDTSSICQMIEDVSRHPTSPGVCATIICLNAKGKPARGGDHVARVVLCRGTDFRKGPDGRMICKKCWSPNASVYEEASEI